MNIKNFASIKINDSGLVRAVPTIAPDAKIDDVLTQLSKDLHFVAVTPKDSPEKILGVVSSSDLTKIARREDSPISGELAAGSHAHRIKFVRQDQTLNDVREVMKQTGHRTIPILDNEGNFKGVITAADLRRKLANEVSIEL